MPLFKATENALLSSTVQVIITTKTVKVKDKLSDDFMVLLHDSSKANEIGYYTASLQLDLCSYSDLLVCSHCYLSAAPGASEGQL